MAVKVMVLRRDGACRTCGASLPSGTRAQWDSAAKAVTCLACVAAEEARPPEPAPATDRSPSVDPVTAADQAPPVAPLDVGQAGRSAREEHDRRRAKREAQIEQRWGSGRLGRVVKALSDDPQTTKAWAAGAAGEERVAQVLHDRLGDVAVLLHDRKVPGTRGNIDHLVVAPSGVWIVDAKQYKGKVERRDVGGWLRSDVRLYVGGRDRTKAVAGLGWQIEAVQRALAPEEVGISSALSFVGAEWPLFFAKPFRLQGVWISWPSKLAELIGAPGPLTESDVARVARLLSERLPSK